MLSTIKPQLEKAIIPFAKKLSFVHPNVLTCLGIIPPALFFLFFVQGNYIAALVMLLGSGIDLLDGAVARMTHRVTAFGGFLDSTIDRISDFLFIFAFSFGGIVRWEITAPFLLFSFLISYTRSRGELASDGKVSFAVGLVERTERTFAIFLATITTIAIPDFAIGSYNSAEVILLVAAILSGVTFIQRVVYGYKKL